MKLSRRAKIIIIFVVVVIVGYSLTLFSQSRNQAPESFLNAQNQGSAIAENIVSTSNQSTAELEKINQLDQDGDYSQALASTTALVNQSQDLRNQAVALSNQVQTMTEALSTLNSLSARQAALEAISSQLALINQLITYSNDLDKLLGVLQNHFNGIPVQSGEVVGLVNQINTDVSAINNFNTQSTQAMTQFDEIVGK